MIYSAAVLVVVSLVFFAAFVSLSTLGQRGQIEFSKEGNSLISSCIEFKAFEGDLLDNLSTVIAKCSTNKCRDVVIRSNGEAIARRLFEDTAGIFHIEEFGPSIAHSGWVRKCLPSFGKRMWSLEYAKKLAAIFKSNDDFVSYFITVYKESDMIFDLIDGMLTIPPFEPFLKTPQDKSEGALVCTG